MLKKQMLERVLSHWATQFVRIAFGAIAGFVFSVIRLYWILSTVEIDHTAAGAVPVYWMFVMMPFWVVTGVMIAILYPLGYRIAENFIGTQQATKRHWSLLGFGLAMSTAITFFLMLVFALWMKLSS